MEARLRRIFSKRGVSRLRKIEDAGSEKHARSKFTSPCIRGLGPMYVVTRRLDWAADAPRSGLATPTALRQAGGVDRVAEG